MYSRDGNCVATVSPKPRQEETCKCSSFMECGCGGFRTGTLMKTSEHGKNPSGAMKGGQFFD